MDVRSGFRELNLPGGFKLLWVRRNPRRGLLQPKRQRPGTNSAAVTQMGVNYEPFIFLLDEQGTVLRRLDHIWDNAELKGLLSLI